MVKTRRDVLGAVLAAGAAQPLLIATGADVASAAPAAGPQRVGELRTTVGKPGQAVLLAGYHEAGDGGGGWFAWSDEPAPDDGGLFIASGPGGWRRARGEQLTLRHFGARGDGVTDDTAAVQRAVDATAAAGLKLGVPDGVFLLKPVGVERNSFDPNAFAYCVRLPGGLAMAGPGTFLVAGAFEACGTPFIALNAADIELAGFTVLGRIEGSSKNWFRANLGISLGRCTDCRLDGVSIKGMRGGILAFNSSRVAIVNCSAERVPSQTERSGSHFGLYTCTYSEISSCQTFGETNDGDIGVFGYPGYQNRILNNRLFQAPRGSLLPVSGSSAGQGIFVDSGQSDVLVEGNLVSGYFYGIDVKTLVTDIVVRGNQVEKCFVGIAIRFGEGKDINARVSCIDNRIAINGGGLHKPRPGFLDGARAIGILADGSIVDSLVIAGNRISDSQYFFDGAAEAAVPAANYRVEDAVALRPERFFAAADSGATRSQPADFVRVEESETFWIGIWIGARSDDFCQLTISGNRVNLGFEFYRWNHQSSGSALKIRGGALTGVSLTDNDFTAGASASLLVDIAKVGTVRASGNRFATEAKHSALYITDSDSASILDNRFEAEATSIKLARVQSARIADNELTGTQAVVISCEDVDLAGLTGNRFRTAAARLDLVSFTGGRLSGADNVAIVPPSTKAGFPEALAEADGNRVLRTLQLTRTATDAPRR